MQFTRRITTRGNCCHVNALNEYGYPRRLSIELEFVKFNFARRIFSFEDTTPGLNAKKVSTPGHYIKIMVMIRTVNNQLKIEMIADFSFKCYEGTNIYF